MPQGSSLGSIVDLKGKRVGIAEAGSDGQAVLERILSDLGIDRANINAAELDQSQSAERLADDHLDAYFYTAATPEPAMNELDRDTGLELYSFTAEELAIVTQAVPYYTALQIPAGTYSSVTYDVDTVAGGAILGTHANHDEQLIYAVTKALWSDTTRKLLDDGHAKGRAITPETALDGIAGTGVPLHPGAERFYREAGLLK